MNSLQITPKTFATTLIENWEIYGGVYIKNRQSTDDII